jgi:hypothetical protein
MQRRGWPPATDRSWLGCCAYGPLETGAIGTQGPFGTFRLSILTSWIRAACDASFWRFRCPV